MDSGTAPLGGLGWHIAIGVVFLFLWLIPLFHASRAGRAMPIIEVLVLLAMSVLIPIAAGVFATGSPAPALVGAVFIVPMIGGAGVLWFAALLIALAAELGETLRPPRPRYPPPRRIPDDERFERGR